MKYVRNPNIFDNYGIILHKKKINKKITTHPTYFFWTCYPKLTYFFILPSALACWIKFSVDNILNFFFYIYIFLIFPRKHDLTSQSCFLGKHHMVISYGITKTYTCMYLYNFDPINPNFYIIKTGVYRGIHYFSYFCSKIWIVGTC